MQPVYAPDRRPRRIRLCPPPAAGIVVMVSVADEARKPPPPLPEGNYREPFTGKMQRLREGTIVDLPPPGYLTPEWVTEKQHPE